MIPLGRRQSTCTDTGIRWWPHSSPEEGGMPGADTELRVTRGNIGPASGGGPIAHQTRAALPRANTTEINQSIRQGCPQALRIRTKLSLHRHQLIRRRIAPQMKAILTNSPIEINHVIRRNSPIDCDAHEQSAQKSINQSNRTVYGKNVTNEVTQKSINQT